jgi:prepilin-type N-terminal cleavage/methylation domain-containing protein
MHAQSTPADTRPRLIDRLRRRGGDSRGFTLIEMLIGMSIALVIFGATMTTLEVMMRTQNRNQAYALEVLNTQTAFARLMHDLRQATLFTSVTPNSVAFQMVVSSTTYNVAYSCTAADSLGGAYTRCARTQALAPATPAAPGTTATSTDIVHVANGGISTFCNANGTTPSGSVFFPANPNVPNTDGSTLVCDEAYEREIAELQPTSLQLHIQVPRNSGYISSGLTHQTVLSSAVFIPNLDAGS